MCKNETGPLLADPVATVDFFPYETSHAFSIWPAPGQTAPAVRSAHVCLELSPIPLVAGRPFSHLVADLPRAVLGEMTSIGWIA